MHLTRSWRLTLRPEKRKGDKDHVREELLILRRLRQFPEMDILRSTYQGLDLKGSKWI